MEGPKKNQKLKCGKKKGIIDRELMLHSASGNSSRAVFARPHLTETTPHPPY
ncbi:hypothetical protein HYC85_020408 [Camellia sinensis]|uniref:Uncharacterized protein n=1 Tax=Camellia sinensis TaxID=4442 RepID=A0A7J7GTD3_CAMSI|nr:hypothetical protein HYC85_020408 [Camellia sinensis]